MIKKVRRGRRPKTLKEKRAEFALKMEKILRIASMFHNIKRNKESCRLARTRTRKFEKELKKTRDKDVRITLKYLLDDYNRTANKLESFISEDVKIIGAELKSIKLNGA